MSVQQAPCEPFVHVAEVADTKFGEATPNFGNVQCFLQRFGYLLEDSKETPESGHGGPARARVTGILDADTSTALARYQDFHGLPVTGLFDTATREMMTRPRCGLPDSAAIPLRFVRACAWRKTWLTYSFDTGTADIAGDDERQAVRNAFVTWAAAAPLAFTEVAPNQHPDVLIRWGNANCGDTDMTGGVAAHADYPPGCGRYGNALPRPVHFNDQQVTFIIGAAANSLDLESVALHEIGHILGLQHSDDPGALMANEAIAFNTMRRALTNDDVEGIRKLYPPTGPLIAKHSSKCLVIAGHSRDNGAEAIQWDYFAGKNVIFRIEWVEKGFYKLIPMHATNKVLDIRDRSTANRAQVQQWEWWGGGNQRFALEPVGHGYYRIVAKDSGRVLDVLDRSESNGAKVIQFDWWGGDNQRWRIGPAPITSMVSRKVVDIKDLSRAPGAQVIQWDYWGGGNQRLRLDPVDPLGSGVYRIMIEHSGMCLDVENHSPAGEARIIQWPYLGTDNQHWLLEKVAFGRVKFVARHSGKCLTVSGDPDLAGAQLVQRTYEGDGSQLWRL
ncbi:putative peptidoglycan binding protein [Nocardia bhagyanarayanae]|uniref:Putative peptidoglycan binding protein n=2 Tax=Nocardia bhagyanarayanae TaxID=1215925 RepID=A0A543EXZ3_9NOCA|nr:putative peptidoglycan binding protein [Nocardia bhagyanarayanae]